MSLHLIVLSKLAQWKDENHLSNHEIAQKLGVSDALIGQYFNRQKPIPNTRFKQIADLLTIHLDELLSDGPETYTVRLHGNISCFAGELGFDRVISRIECNYL